MKGTDEALFEAVADLFASGLDVARVAGIKTTVADPGELFWRRVDRRGPDECWVWRGYTDVLGFGRLKIGRSPVYAHRHSWTLTNGRPVPAGMQIVHTCGRRDCVNPAHLIAQSPRFWPRIAKTRSPSDSEG